MAIKRFLLIILFGFTGGITDMAAAEPGPLRPWESPVWTVETGMLWQVGSLTPIAYRLAPLQVSWMSREFFGRELQDGSRIILRHRWTLLGNAILRGPESRYVGFSCSPSLEWWNRAGNWSVFSGAGGGFGWIDSRNVTGGQGQDFTLNWFIRGGIEHITENHVRLSAGLMYQHMSNGGQTDPNPGIDAVGFTLGYSWSF